MDANTFNKALPIAIGADHAGVEYKNQVKEWLAKLGYTVTDFGTNDSSSVDYPDFAHPVANAVEKGMAEMGILFCGSANGVAITANKHQQVRAALCWQNEIAVLARQHNNANIICIPSRFVSYSVAEEMILSFINTGFEGGRHQNRVNKIAC